jgi:heme/copper-type cytochrome/quinol oxidase subunit 2
MKRKIYIRIAFLAVTAFFMVTCVKSDIEKSRDAYNATKIVPIVQGISGSASVLQTFSYDYTLTYDRSGSTWAWTGVDCTVQTVSADTRTAKVLFTAIPVGGKAKVQVVETTVGGQVSPVKEFLATVNPFCPLAITGFVGSWSGTDGAGTGAQLFPSQVVTSAPSGTSIKVTGLNYGWMVEYWGETITAGGTINMTVNANGTTTIPDQYCFTTDYNGDPYIYWVKGTGIWGNCGPKPTLTLKYQVYYKSDNYTMPSATTFFNATLTLGAKGLEAGANVNATKSEVAGLSTAEKKLFLSR